jgi:hypothetical protein
MRRIDMNIRKLAPLFFEKWTPSRYKPDVIVGYWAEDGNEYEIIVPVQLRDLLIEFQNNKVDALRAECAKKKHCPSCGGNEWRYDREADKNVYCGYPCSCQNNP